MFRLKTLLISLAASVSLMIGLSAAPALALTAPATLAVASSSQQDACAGLSQLDSGTGCNSSASKGLLGKLSSTVVQILLIIVGIASVIMIIIAGLRYVTAGGDSNSIASAKNTLIYALVGLVVASLAELLTHYVLSKL